MKDRIVFHLDNCPFCGSLDVCSSSDKIGRGDGMEKIYYILCTQCGTLGPHKMDEIEAHKAWNSRDK